MQVKYEVVPAEYSHIEPIARRVRQSDCDEVWAAGMVMVRTALEMSLERANIAQSWLIDGVPAACGGINGPREGAIIWLITTDLVDKHRREFLEASRMCFLAARGDFNLLCNFIDVRNTRAIRWLRFLGFTMDEAKPYGVMGRPFHFFYWRNPAQEVASDCIIG